MKNKKRLTEGTSNFWSMENFPLLIFAPYEDIDDRIIDRVKDELPDDFNGEIWDTEEYEKAWDEIDYCVLDEDEVNRLEKDIKDFCYDMNHDDRYDWEEDADVEIEVKPGYYEAAQIYVKNEKYLQDWQIDEINKFLKELKEKYNLTTLGVSYRASNGETGCHIIKEKCETGRREAYNPSESDIKKNPALKYNKSIKEEDEKLEESDSDEESQTDDNYHIEEVDESLWEDFKRFKNIQEKLNRN